jgi:hypothetical protein
VIEKHLMKLRARDQLSAAEEEAICEAVTEYRDYRSDLTFIEPHKGFSTARSCSTG